MGLVLVCLAVIFYTCLVYCLLVLFITASVPQCQTNFAGELANNTVLALCDDLPLSCLTNWSGRVFRVSPMEARKAETAQNIKIAVSEALSQLLFLGSKLAKGQVAIVVFRGHETGIEFTEHLRCLLATIDLDNASLICPQVADHCSWRGLRVKTDFNQMRCLIIRKTAWLESFFNFLGTGLPFEDAVRKTPDVDYCSDKKPRKGSSSLVLGCSQVCVSSAQFFEDVSPSKLTKGKQLLYSLVWQKPTYA